MKNSNVLRAVCTHLCCVISVYRLGGKVKKRITTARCVHFKCACSVCVSSPTSRTGSGPKVYCQIIVYSMAAQHSAGGAAGAVAGKINTLANVANAKINLINLGARLVEGGSSLLEGGK